MSKVLLGAVPTYSVNVTAPESGGVVSVTPNAQSGASATVPQPNQDGTYSILLPDEYKTSSPVVALNEGDISTGESASVVEEVVEEIEEDESEGGVKKYLPYLIVGGLALFFFMRKK